MVRLNDLQIHDFIIVEVVEITEHGFEFVSAPFVEVASRNVLWATGGLDVDASSSHRRNLFLGDVDQSSAKLLSLEFAVDGDPVHIKAVDGAGNQTVARIANCSDRKSTRLNSSHQ